jgi:hypothetical protein
MTTKELKAKCPICKKERLEYLRRELRGERISYGELSELQSLAQYIASGDVELLEAAGVPEFVTHCKLCGEDFDEAQGHKCKAI